MSTDFGKAAEDIVFAGRFMDARGWAPAGSGNYSCRLDDDSIAITVSGRHKGRITTDDVMRVDIHGHAIGEGTPSAETLLHTLMYRMFRRVKVVLHSHSVPAVVLSRLVREDRIRLSGYELLKAFRGVDANDPEMDIPVFANSQNMVKLSAMVERVMLQGPAPVFLIRDHGLYGWGDDLEEALRVIEAAETLLACEVELMKAGRR